MPMLYVIKQGANSIKYHLKSISSEEIIYCITSIESILKHKLDEMFSDGHAVSDLTQFYDQSRIVDIDRILDKEAINAKYWLDENDLDLKRRKEAEFLIGGDLPVTTILGYAVYNDNTKQKLVDMGISETMVAIKSNYYF